jgi:putative glutamine amidotransferase
VELAAVAAADRADLPILGVCRGIQVLNVARGGSIFQDLARQYPGAVRDHSRGPSRADVQTHEVELTGGSCLAGLLGAARVAIATDHHQAVKDLGRDLAVVARATEDGVIEAVEASGARFVVAVQWHPEVRPEDDATLRLFTGFVAAAARFAAERIARHVPGTDG